MDRRAALGVDQARAADRQCEVRAVHHAGRSVANAGTFDAGARLAVLRGSANGRSNESADAPDDGYLRPGAAESERCADPRRGAVEIRLQEREVAGEDPLPRQATADQLEHVRVERI